MSLPDSHDIDAALSTLNRVRPPDGLAERVQMRLESREKQSPRRLMIWRPIFLTPLAAAVVALAWIAIGHQAAPWRPIAPEAVRAPAPSRVLTSPDSAAALASRPGGRRVSPTQPQPLRTAHAQPTVPFVYPQTRETQLRFQAASEARVTDRAVFDPRSDVESASPASPK